MSLTLQAAIMVMVGSPAADIAGSAARIVIRGHTRTSCVLMGIRVIARAATLGTGAAAVVAAAPVVARRRTTASAAPATTVGHGDTPVLVVPYPTTIWIDRTGKGTIPLTMAVLAHLAAGTTLTGIPHATIGTAVSSTEPMTYTTYLGAMTPQTGSRCNRDNRAIGLTGVLPKATARQFLAPAVVTRLIGGRVAIATLVRSDIVRRLALRVAPTDIV